MKKVLLIILFGVSYIYSVAQNQPYDIGSELVEFVDSAKKQSVDTGKYNIYTLQVSDSCVGLKYVYNELTANRIIDDFNKYGIYKGYTFLINNKNRDFEYPKGMNVFPLDFESKKIILSKLYPIQKGFITGITQGMLLCYNGRKIESTYYSNADEMPSNFLLFDMKGGGYNGY